MNCIIVILGITAEEFIGREKIGSSPSGYGQSKMDLFARLMSKKLGSKYHPPNVEVISLINTPSFDHVVDVRFAVHASPYLKPSKLNGILNIYREEVWLSLFDLKILILDFVLKNSLVFCCCSLELITFKLQTHIVIL